MGHRLPPRISLKMAFLLGLFVACALESKLHGQEVALLDLSHTTARTELTLPPRPIGSPKGFGGIHDVYQCSDQGTNTHILRTSLVRLDRSIYQMGDEVNFEITIQNAGSLPLRVPISPHLADFQPTDPGQKFTVLELNTVLLIGGRNWRSTSAIGTKLYGSETRRGTILTLQPGEWISIVDQAKIGVIGPNSDVDRLRKQEPIDHLSATASVSNTDMTVGPTGIATVSRDVCYISQTSPDLPASVIDPRR